MKTELFKKELKIHKNKREKSSRWDKIEEYGCIYPTINKTLEGILIFSHRAS